MLQWDQREKASSGTSAAFLFFASSFGPFSPFMLSVTLLTEELNLRAVGIVTFSGWQLLAIILKCNNVNAICHDWSCRERGKNRKQQTGLGGGRTEGEDGEIKVYKQQRT